MGVLTAMLGAKGEEDEDGQQDTFFEAHIEKREEVKRSEAAGEVADSMDVRLALMERVLTGASDAIEWDYPPKTANAEIKGALKRVRFD